MSILGRGTIHLTYPLQRNWGSRDRELKITVFPNIDLKFLFLRNLTRKSDLVVTDSDRKNKKQLSSQCLNTKKVGTNMYGYYLIFNICIIARLNVFKIWTCLCLVCCDLLWSEKWKCDFTRSAVQNHRFDKEHIVNNNTIQQKKLQIQNNELIHSEYGRISLSWAMISTFVSKGMLIIHLNGHSVY